MTFTARYYSDCASPDCTVGRIAPGQEIEDTDDGYMHAGCAAQHERRTKLPPLCNYCRLHHHGAC